MLTRNSATLANKVIVEVRQLVSDGIRAGLEVITRVVVIAALVGFLVVLDPLMAAIVFGLFLVLYGGIFVASRRYLRRIGREAVTAGAARLKAVNEALGGFKDLKLSLREEAAFERYRGPSRRYAEVQAGVMAIAMLPRYALEAVAVGGMVLVASLLAGRAGSFADTLPLLGAYAFAGLRLMPAMQNLFGAFARVRFARGSLETIEEELAEVAAPVEGFGLVPDPLPFERSIVLRGVTYTYPNARRRPRRPRPGAGSTAQPGDRRRHGLGKTTLVDTLLGLLEPDAGRIEVDGWPCRPTGGAPTGACSATSPRRST